MLQLRTPAIICAVQPHGEHGVILRALTPDHGLVAGYVRGGRSRNMRPVLMAGNSIEASFRARSDTQLAALTAELLQSRGPHLGEPLAVAALTWATALTAATLPEEHGYPALYSALSALLDAICNAPSAKGWAAAMVRYEQLLLAELGFGLALEECAVSGATEQLLYVSRKSARAVSAAAGADYATKLLALPRFMVGGERPDWTEIFDGLRLTGFFLDRHFFADRPRDIMAAREMLVQRLQRAVA